MTRTGVLAAVDEFDRVGREAFLKATGFGPARAYFLEHDGKLYDSKAVIGYAHGVSTAVPLGPGDFSGGDKTVAQRLETLGFTVLNLRLDWTREELILACALAESNGWRQSTTPTRGLRSYRSCCRALRFIRSRITLTSGTQRVWGRRPATSSTSTRPATARRATAVPGDLGFPWLLVNLLIRRPATVPASWRGYRRAVQVPLGH